MTREALILFAEIDGSQGFFKFTQNTVEFVAVGQMRKVMFRYTWRRREDDKAGEEEEELYLRMPNVKSLVVFLKNMKGKLSLTIDESKLTACIFTEKSSLSKTWSLEAFQHTTYCNPEYDDAGVYIVNVKEYAHIRKVLSKDCNLHLGLNNLKIEMGIFEKGSNSLYSIVCEGGNKCQSIGWISPLDICLKIPTNGIKSVKFKFKDGLPITIESSIECPSHHIMSQLSILPRDVR